MHLAPGLAVFYVILFLGLVTGTFRHSIFKMYEFAEAFVLYNS